MFFYASKVLWWLVTPSNVLIGLVVLGIVLLCGAIGHYLHVGRMIESGAYHPANRLVIAVAVLFVLMGGAALIWLF